MLFSPSEYSRVSSALKELYGKYMCAETQIPLLVDSSVYDSFQAVPASRCLKIIDRHGNVLVVRPDATFHVLSGEAGMASEEISRIYYMTELIRFEGDTMQEITQTGAEFFNDPSALAECELISLAMESLAALGIEDYRADLGHCQYLSALLSEEPSLTKEAHSTIHRHISLKNTLDLEDYMLSVHASPRLIEAAKAICLLFGDYAEVLAKARALCLNEGMKNALDSLEETVALLSGRGYAGRLFLDLGFSNWMDYYSGMIFKLYANHASQEVISGGRYDTLASRLGNKRYACGFGHHLDLTIPLSRKAGRPLPSVFIGAPAEEFGWACGLASALREKGYSVEARERAEGLEVHFGEERITDKKTLARRLEEL